MKTGVSNIIGDPKNKNRFFVGTWNSGLIEMDSHLSYCLEWAETYCLGRTKIGRQELLEH